MNFSNNESCFIVFQVINFFLNLFDYLYWKTNCHSFLQIAQLSKFEEGGGLGISLEGTVDVEDGREVRPHHYIRSILPDGPVGKNSILRSGDELLEVCLFLGSYLKSHSSYKYSKYKYFLCCIWFFLLL